MASVAEEDEGRGGGVEVVGEGSRVRVRGGSRGPQRFSDILDGGQIGIERMRWKDRVRSGVATWVRGLAALLEGGTFVGGRRW